MLGGSSLSVLRVGFGCPTYSTLPSAPAPPPMHCLCRSPTTCLRRARHHAQAMRIEIDFEGGKNSAGLFVHKLLSESMGYSTAAFAQSVLLGQTQPGVWYPEEREALKVRGSLAAAAAGYLAAVGWPAWVPPFPVPHATTPFPLLG